MPEKERPLGIKIIFISFLLDGIGGLCFSLMGSRADISSIFSKSFLGQVFSVEWLKTMLCILSLIFLWFSYLVFSLKKVAWYILFWIQSLNFLFVIGLLFALSVNKITLTKIDKIGFLIGTITMLYGYYYLRTRRPYFDY